ncbi:serine/threonine protein kinase [Polytolypa hystricis UAMH7299]|uniref:Serine/threonine protein kinase n=1 Tax=Polytolypa hystricis (strain UAMH7299) TaxID=1447883 RepID=A0A2B7YGA4_POLH7|nr:serine/threonine protein kinase [Polytolypa hystricis UAMH7299]
MQSTKEPLTLSTMLKGDSRQAYKILAYRRKPLLYVYRASAEGRKYVVKNLIQGEFEYQLNLQKSLSSCPNVRAVVDTAQELKMFIYPYLSEDLLRLSQKRFSKETRRSILRNALNGLADMHDRDILHNGKYIKPNYILMDYEESAEGRVIIKNVQISDLEDTVIVPTGKWLRGPLCGNAIWKCAESCCRSRQNQASDVFSFAIMIIYVMVNEMAFRVNDDQLNAADSWRYILRRHIILFCG